MRILHLSDSHYLGDNRMNGKRGISRNLSDSLERVSAYLVRPEYGADVIVVSGDLLDRTGNAEYAEIVQIFQKFAEKHALPLMLTLGNHDNHDRAAAYVPGFTVQRVNGYRLIGLENIDPQLTEQQLASLSAELRTPSEHGTVLVVHHSPISSPVTSLIGRGMEEVNGFAAAIANSDVRLILTGHYHHVQSGMFNGVPVWTSPALANHTRTNPDVGTASALVQSGFSFISLDPTNTTSFMAMPIWLDDFPEIFTKQL